MKNNKGITLIALIITIIVLIIIAGVALNLTVGENSTIVIAKKAELDHKIGEVKEAVFLYGMSTGEWAFEEKTKTALQAMSETKEIKILQNEFGKFKEYNIGKVSSLERAIMKTVDNPYEGTNMGQKFYIIDISKLGKNIDIGSKKNGEDDIFIMCEKTKNVYYAKGRKITLTKTYHGEKNANSEQNQDNIVNFPITEPGTYKITANAGTKAIWLNVLLQDLYMPEGSQVNLKYETSDDRTTWEKPVYKIEEAKNTQYLRVTIELIANEKGESPTIAYAKIKFKPVNDEAQETAKITQEENIEKTEDGWKPKPGTTGKVETEIELEKPQKIESVKVPVIKNGIVVDEIEANTTKDGITTKVQVSKDGITWEDYDKESDEEYKHIKVTVTTDNPDVEIGKPIINSKDADIIVEKLNWKTTRINYYYFDAMQVGTWISIQADEIIPNHTRIKYTFSKSNDDLKWTQYDESITANGDSRYIMVKVEFQKENENIKEEAKLNDLLINYKVNGENKSTSIKDKGLVVIATDINGGRWEIVASNLNKKIEYIEYKKNTETTYKTSNGNRVEINENATYIVVVTYADNTKSEEVTVIVNGIKPISITAEYSTEYFTQDNVVITVSATGLGGIKQLKYKKGEWNTDYFKLNGIDLLENNKIIVPENGTYTLYTKDGEGNEKIKVISIYNIMPKLEYKGEISTDKGIVEYVKNTNILDGKYKLTIKDQSYNIELYNYNNDVKYDRTSYVGDEIADQTMVIIKYNKNLILKEGSSLIPQTRKKGMYVCVNETIQNNGEITMTARGAIAEGQDVYLYKNSDGTYEYVPAVGGIGGASINSNSGPNEGGMQGKKGENGKNRATGGGGSGGTWHWINTGGYSGAGAAGTSYSGGSGGGGSDVRQSSAKSPNGGINGGKGGNGISNYSTGHWAGGGAGNSYGTGSYNGGYYSPYNGTSGTGGLLMVYANTILNHGIISSNGSKGGPATHAGGGSSGAGTVNIFYNGNFNIGGNITTISQSVANGGAGGDGSITTTQIK